MPDPAQLRSVISMEFTRVIENCFAERSLWHGKEAGIRQF